MSPRIPVCAAIASLSLSACMSPSANLPRNAILDATSASGLVLLNNSPATQFPAGVADRIVISKQG